MASAITRILTFLALAVCVIRRTTIKIKNNTCPILDTTRSTGRSILKATQTIIVKSNAKTKINFFFAILSNDNADKRKMQENKKLYNTL